jgi:serine/threonine protein kinase
MSLHQKGDLIAQKYKIINLLGEGGSGSTYQARDLNSNRLVAIKVVSLLLAENWKTLELFEREAKVLKNLDHPFIPNYIDYFQIDTAGDRRFYLVQELAQGQSLVKLVEKGWKPNEAVVKDIALQVLHILDYLHKLTPPVIHRDIKPQNIIRRDDGKVYLVDFGAVQDVYRNTLTRGETFVGTYGYMPPEQFRGHITFASDLYSLGATLLFLLTGRSPDTLPQKRMKIDFRPWVNLSPAFTNWLDKVLEPYAEERFQSAEEAIAFLTNPEQAAILAHSSNSESSSIANFSAAKLADRPEQNSLARISKPRGSRVRLVRSLQRLKIEIPAKSDDPRAFTRSVRIAIGMLAISSVFIAAFISMLTNGYGAFIAIVVVPFQFLLIGVGSYAYATFKKFSTESLTISPRQFVIKRKFLQREFAPTAVKIANIVEVYKKTTFKKGRKYYNFVIQARFGNYYPFWLDLSESEIDWLVWEVNDFLTNLTPEKPRVKSISTEIPPMRIARDSQENVSGDRSNKLSESNQAVSISKPIDSNIELEKLDLKLSIHIPPDPRESSKSKVINIIKVLMVVILFLAAATIRQIIHYGLIEYFNVAVITFSGMLILLVVIYVIAFAATSGSSLGLHEKVVLDPQKFIIKRKRFNREFDPLVGKNREFDPTIGKISDIDRIYSKKTVFKHDSPKYTCVIMTRKNREHLVCRNRTEREVDWLVQEINNFLAQLPNLSRFN